MAEEFISVEDIVFPSEFKIKITSVLDENGANIPYGSQDFPVHVNFVVMDNYGGTYLAIYDTEASKCKNVYVEDDHIFVVVQNYKLKGNLKIKVSIAKADDNFKDGTWDAWGKPTPLPANIVEYYQS